MHNHLRTEHTKFKLTQMTHDKYKQLVEQANKEIYVDYYKKHRLEKIRERMGLLGCQFKAGMINFRLRNLSPMIKSIAWGMSKGGHNFMGRFLQKVVFGKFYFFDNEAGFFNNPFSANKKS